MSKYFRSTFTPFFANKPCSCATCQGNQPGQALNPRVILSPLPLAELSLQPESAETAARVSKVRSTVRRRGREVPAKLQKAGEVECCGAESAQSSLPSSRRT